MPFFFHRIRNFLKRRPPSPPPAPVADAGHQQRSFERFPIEFDVAIAFEDASGNTVQEHTVLQNVSGGGAMFLTHFPDRYQPGQALRATIYLAGTKEVQASIHAEASVVRIHALEAGSTGIAVQFSRPLAFQRLKPSI